MPEISYKPEPFIIEDFPHGDTFLPDQIAVKDKVTDEPIDLTAYEAEMRLEEKDGTEVVTLTHTDGITLGDGFILLRADTETWPSNCTIYGDLQMIDGDGVRQTWMSIVVKIKKTITNPV